MTPTPWLAMIVPPGDIGGPFAAPSGAVSPAAGALTTLTVAVVVIAVLLAIIATTTTVRLVWARQTRNLGPP